MADHINTSDSEAIRFTYISRCEVNSNHEANNEIQPLDSLVDFGGYVGIEPTTLPRLVRATDLSPEPNKINELDEELAQKNSKKSY